MAIRGIGVDLINHSVKTDDSARSDKLTGGRIEQAPFVEGDPRIWITIDVPAFRLTLWQAGKEVKAYPGPTSTGFTWGRRIRSLRSYNGRRNS